jgi:threonine/homoserine/homoserine lactone efflux protein
VLPIAVAVAIFPVPIIAVVLLLSSEQGTAKGLAFVLAWCAGLAAVGAIVLLFAGAVDASEAGEPATWVNVLLLSLGLLLLGLAVKEWRARPRANEEALMPSWMRKMDEYTPNRAGGVGFALSALNPKNVLLTVAAGAEVASVGLPSGQEITVMLVFVLVASAGVLSPLAVSLALGERSRELLDAIKGWMTRNSAAILTVLFLIIGAKLIGDSISGFSS